MASLAQICHTIAYTIIPNYVYMDLNRMKKLWQEEGLAGPTFYTAACRMLKASPNRTDANSFKTITGKVDDQQTYLLLQFPPPPPIDLAKIRPDSLPNASIVLSPYFCIALGSETLPYLYYVLGQGTFGGTTLRYISSESINLNMGPGPSAVDVNLFIDIVKTRPMKPLNGRKTGQIPPKT